MDRFALAIATWIALGLALAALRRRSPLDLCAIAIGTTAVVATFFPLGALLVEPLSWRHGAAATESEIVAAQIEFLAFACGIACAVGVVAALGHVSLPRVAPAPSRAASTLERDRLVAWSLLGAGAALYLVYVAKVGLAALVNRDDYAEKYLASIGLGPFAIGIQLMIAGCLWAESSSIARPERWTFRAVAVLIAVWSFGFISVRSNAVILGLGYAYVFCRSRRVEVRRVRPMLVLGLVAGYALLETFSMFRGAAQEVGLERALALVEERADSGFGTVVGGSETTHPFITTIEVMQSERAGDLRGASYLDGIPALAPLFLVPDRPEVLMERFVREQYAETWSKGGGTAFSLVAEAWWNFGSLGGPFAIGAALAWILLFVERRAALHPSSTLARLLPYCAFLVFIAQRSESAVLLKQVVSIVLFVLPPLLVALVLDLRRSERAPRHALAN